MSQRLSSQSLLLLAIAAVLACVFAANAEARSTFLVSDGPGSTGDAGNTTHEGISGDGLRAFFSTQEPMTADDTDGQLDVFERGAGGSISRVSTGPSGGNGPFGALYAGNSEDGSRVVFSTLEPLTPDDLDDQRDVFMREGGVTTRLSTGPAGGNGPAPASAQRVAGNGQHVFIQTREQLTLDDGDDKVDVYDASPTGISLVSKGTQGGGGSHAFFVDASRDGSALVFKTWEPLIPSDTDGLGLDNYVRRGSDVYVVGGTYRAIVPDGLRIYTTTGGDIFEQTSVGSTLITTMAESATFRTLSRDGSHLYFTTGGSAVTVYEYTAGELHQLFTDGSDSFFFGGSSDDGTAMYFTSRGSFVEHDSDGAYDLYELRGGAFTVISVPGTGTSGPNTFTGSGTFVSAPLDGRRVFFTTSEKMAANDNDAGAQDIFERVHNETYLVSTGPTSTNQSILPTFRESSDDGTRVFFETTEQLVPVDTDAQSDAYISMDYYAYPKGATPMHIPLVMAQQPCTSPNRVHAEPLSFGSCSPPAGVSDLLEWGTPDANGASANGSGSVRLRVTGTLDDMAIDASVTDVRCRTAFGSCGTANAGAGPDYTGELRGVLPVRLSDRNNGPYATEQATLPDLELQFPLACTETAADDQEGSGCSASTSINTLYPGAVQPGSRAVFALEAVRIEDGGTDGQAATGPNETFLTQGVFTP